MTSTVRFVHLHIHIPKVLISTDNNVNNYFFGTLWHILASFPGLPTVQVLITSSMQRCIKNWMVGRSESGASTICVKLL